MVPLPPSGPAAPRSGDVLDEAVQASVPPPAVSARMASVPPASKSWVGDELDHYQVIGTVGEGGMGVVYLGHDRSLDRQVALKVLPPEVAVETELQERFIREARAQARLQSPHVTHIHFIGRTPERPGRPPSLYFAMEYVSGGSLDDLIEAQERLEPERARRLVLEAAKGLREAHRAGIVHRDVKPGNLLLDQHGLLKIADFGVAKPLDKDSKVSRHGMVIGSPLYMPPEQAKGLPVDHRADMYSLGCTFFHLVTGQPPYDGDTSLAVVSKHMTEPPASVRALAPEVPPAFAAVLERLMAKEPGDRYPDYDALIAALEAAAPRSTSYAGLWVRLAAALVDAFLGGLLIGFLGWPGLIVYLTYLTVGHSWKGKTVGKRMFHLRVRRIDGGSVGIGRSVARTFASLWMPIFVMLTVLLTEGFGELTHVIEILQPQQLDAVQSFLLAAVIGNTLLAFLYAVGMVMAAFHPQRRAAHDLLAGTCVTYELPDAAAQSSTSPPPKR